MNQFRPLSGNNVRTCL